MGQPSLGARSRPCFWPGLELRTSLSIKQTAASTSQLCPLVPMTASGCALELVDLLTRHGVSTLEVVISEVATPNRLWTGKVRQFAPVN